MTTVFVAGAATDQLIVDAVTRAAREAGLDVVSNVDADVLALVASPASAADSLVDLTVQQWAASHRVEDLLIVLAAGNVVWPTTGTEFDDATSASRDCS